MRLILPQSKAFFPLQAHMVSQFLSSGKKSCFGKAEEFHSTKVSQLLAFCHKNGGFRDVITRGFRASGHKSLSFTLPWKTVGFWHVVEWTIAGNLIFLLALPLPKMLSYKKISPNMLRNQRAYLTLVVLWPLSAEIPGSAPGTSVSLLWTQRRTSIWKWTVFPQLPHAHMAFWKKFLFSCHF